MCLSSLWAAHSSIMLVTMERLNGCTDSGEMCNSFAPPHPASLMVIEQTYTLCIKQY